MALKSSLICLLNRSSVSGSLRKQTRISRLGIPANNGVRPRKSPPACSPLSIHQNYPSYPPPPRPPAAIPRSTSPHASANESYSRPKSDKDFPSPPNAHSPAAQNLPDFFPASPAETAR